MRLISIFYYFLPNKFKKKMEIPLTPNFCHIPHSISGERVRSRNCASGILFVCSALLTHLVEQNMS